MPTDENVHRLSVELPSACSPAPSRDYMAVSIDVVYFTIGVLRCIVAQWQPPEGIGPEDQAANRLMTATCQALAGLMHAHTAHNRLLGAPELVELIASFLGPQWAQERLEAVRPRTDRQRDIVEVLLALARKRQERTP